MPTTVRALFFDLDGTLLNTYEADYCAYRDALAEVAGVIITKEDFMKTNGREARDKVAILVPSFPIERIDEVRQAKKKAYPNYLHLTEPNEPLIAFVREMAGDYQLGLVTTAKQKNAEAALRHHGLLDLFSIVVYGDEVAEPKPSPKPYLLALKKAGVSADESLAFEDSETGIQSAHSAGIRTIHIRRFQ